MPDRSNGTLSLLTVPELRSGSLPSAAFAGAVLHHGLRYVRRTSFPVGDLPLEQLQSLAEIELAEDSDRELAVVLRMDERTLVHLTAHRGQGELAVAGDDPAAVARIAADLAIALRDRRGEGEQVPVTFWARGSVVPMISRRLIPAPRWEEIRANYGASAQAALGPLMAAREPGAGGLLLWHGPPGTGKSTALRALAREWRSWCDIHFIADPDTFLGADSTYLLRALLSNDARAAWRLIVLEDAGELLAPDARAVAGQAVSRLLNLTDGILGQGLQTLVLVTTNEPVGRLHPAVSRPGRTWAEVEFPALTAGEANAWLRERGADARVSGELPLAELFALGDGRPVRERVAVGFAAQAGP